MATGFTTRWKGKIAAAEIWVSGQPIAGPSARQSLTLVNSSLATPTSAGTFINLVSSGSTTNSLVNIEKPNFVGDCRLFVMSTLNGLGVTLLASTAGAGTVTFNGSSNTVIKSTGSTVQSIEMMATSLTNWALVGAYPGFASSTGGILWTLSTSS